MTYKYPPTGLLSYSDEKGFLSRPDYAQIFIERIQYTFKSLKIHASISSYNVTSLAMVFVCELEEGYSFRTFKSHRTDIELSVATYVEINAGNDGKVYLILKAFPRPIVGLRTLIESKEFADAPSPLSVVVGVDIMGNPLVIDIEQLPHLLIAGSTGSGKSVFIDDLIISLIYKASPHDVGLLLIDPNAVELNPYNGVPHLIAPVVDNATDAFAALAWVEDEMMKRYRSFEEKGVKHIDQYNQIPECHLMKIVVIIDEYKDLMDMADKDAEQSIIRITRMARAAGIHLIIATQVAVNKVVTAAIKANIPSRVAFTLVDNRESKAVLDITGAERLLGRGDMIVSVSDEGTPIHGQAAYVSFEEILKVVGFAENANRKR